MKNQFRITNFFLLVLFISTTSAFAKGGNNSNNVPSPSSVDFVYQVPNIPQTTQTDYSEHLLGNDVASKWSLFEELYIRRTKTTVGISSSTLTFVKPQIYKAVNKMNNHFSKLVKNSNHSKEENIKKFAHYLDCANVMAYYDKNTNSFESELLKAHNIEQIIAVFDRVKIEVY